MINNLQNQWREAHFHNPAEWNEETIWRWFCRNAGWRYPNPYTIGSPEFEDFERRLSEKEAERNRKYTDLPDPVIKPFTVSKRRMGQPIFKMQFETLADIQLRILHTLIFVGSDLFFVRSIYQMDGDYLLLIEDPSGARFKVWYNACPHIDLRSPEPQYLRYPRYPVYMYRPPVRQQRQGIDGHRNIAFRGPDGMHVNLSPSEIQEGISPEVFAWSPAYERLMVDAKAMGGLRLSKTIAVYPGDKQALAEYRGRFLGKIKEDTIFVDEKDYSKPWIRSSIDQIGCRSRVSS